MGNELSRPQKCEHDPKHRRYSIPDKNGLEEYDFMFFNEITGKSKSEIEKIFDRYGLNKDDVKINKETFDNIYHELHHAESKERIKDVSNHVFNAFDKNECTGHIKFNEFMLAYSLTNHGDMRRKLEYSFDLYDVNKTGYLEKNDIKDIVYGMVEILGIHKKHDNPQKLIDKIIREVHVGNSDHIYKGKSSSTPSSTH